MAIIDNTQIFSFVQNLMNQGVDGIDALLTFAKENDIEPEVIGEIVRRNPNLLSLIEESAEQMNFIAKRERLPFD